MLVKFEQFWEKKGWFIFIIRCIVLYHRNITYAGTLQNKCLWMWIVSRFVQSSALKNSLIQVFSSKQKCKCLSFLWTWNPKVTISNNAKAQWVVSYRIMDWCTFLQLNNMLMYTHYLLIRNDVSFTVNN